MMGNCLIFTLAFMFLTTALDVWMLYIGRFLCGIASGTIFNFVLGIEKTAEIFLINGLLLTK